MTKERTAEEGSDPAIIDRLLDSSRGRFVTRAVGGLHTAAVPPHSLSTNCIDGETTAELSPGERAEAVENLRAYILFLERMDEKYRPERRIRISRERRARRAVDAAFANGVDSSAGGC